MILEKKKIELFYHHAMPGWCKITGLHIKPVPITEGTGYMLPEEEAKIIKMAFELEEDNENT